MKKFGRKLAYLVLAGTLLLSGGYILQGGNNVYAKEVQDYGEDSSTDSDFVVVGTTLVKYKGSSEVVDLTIHDKTKSIDKIGSQAFYNEENEGWNTSLTAIKIPKTVATIGDSAFGDSLLGGCSSLNTVDFDDGSQIATIGEYAFSNTGLKEIEIPEKCSTIKTGALSCEYLEKVTFNGNPNISENAFRVYQDNLVFYSATDASNVKTYAKVNDIRYNRLISELIAEVDPEKLVCYVDDIINTEKLDKAVNIKAKPTNGDPDISVKAEDCIITVDGLEEDIFNKNNFTMINATRTQKITFEYSEKEASIEIPVYYRLTDDEDEESQISIKVNGNYTYTGKAIKPELIVKTNDKKELKEKTDYTVEYIDNTDAGTAKVVITGNDDTSIYKGTQTVEFEILKKDIDKSGEKDGTHMNMDIGINPNPSVYRKGQSVEPNVTVSYGDVTLTAGNDYKVSYNDNKNANIDKSQVVIETLGNSKNFTGSTVKAFSIDPLSLEESTTGAEVKVEDQTYTGKEVIPNPIVTVTNPEDGEKSITLENGKDYTVTCRNNIVVGEADMTITGKGNYTGSINTKFTINPAPISSATIADMETPYSGKAIIPVVQAKLNDLELVDGNDYTIEITGGKLTEIEEHEEGDTERAAIDSGIYTLTITGINNFTGTVEKTMRIVGTSIENAKIDVQDVQYAVEDDGKKYEPDVIVTLGSKILDKDKDYKIEYFNNEKPGQAKARITGIGAYEAEVDKLFKVLPIQLFDNGNEEKNAVIDVSDMSYDVESPDKEYKPEVTVSLEGTALKDGEDYTVKYMNNTKPGEAKVIVEGAGVYAGKGETTFAIAWLKLFSDDEENSAQVEEIVDQEYSGTELKPSVAVTLNGNKLEQDKDYKVIYDNNINVGTALAKIIGVGNYILGGEKTVEFKIVASSIANAKIDVKDIKYENADKDGKYMPKPVVTIGDKQLEEGKDYSLTYSDNDKPGDGTVKVTGIGNYKDDATATFKIIGQSLFGDDESTIGGNEGNTDETEDSGNAGGTEGGESSGDKENNDGTDNIGKKGAIVAAISDYTYTGSQIKPDINLTMDGEELKQGIDYEITYNNNVNVGKATATIKGIGKYTYGGEKTVEYNILPASVEAAVISSIPDQQANGKAITPDVTVTISGTVMKKSEDYTISYANNVNAGTATVTVKGIGNYTGEKNATFVIKAADPGTTSSGGEESKSGETKTETTDSTKSDATPTTPVADVNVVKPADKGKLLSVDSLKATLKVTSSDASNPTVAYVGTTNKKATTITIPDAITVDGITYKVTSISAKALAGNKKIKKITVGKNVTSIGKNAFSNCKNLKTIIIKTTALKSVGKNAIKGINSKATIKVPKKQLKVYKKLFGKKTGFKMSIKIKKN